jgi:hypothetical protein
MDQVIEALKAGRLIEAIKQFRLTYGTDLRTAKEACEALRLAFLPDTIPYVVDRRTDHSNYGQYLVLYRYGAGDDYIVVDANDREDAERIANEIVDDRETTLTVRVVAKSVTTRTMKAV